MSDYLIVESEELGASRAFEHRLGLAASLAGGGHRVTVFLVQNAVLGARRGARIRGLDDALAAGVTFLADDFSLRERGIGFDQVSPAIAPSPLESVVDRLARGDKVLWH